MAVFREDNKEFHVLIWHRDAARNLALVHVISIDLHYHTKKPLNWAVYMGFEPCGPNTDEGSISWQTTRFYGTKLSERVASAYYPTLAETVPYRR